MPTSSRPLPPNLPIAAVADLHGHLDLFERLLAEFDRRLGRDYLLVTLGDYVDNGPQIPRLLDRLIALKQERPDRFFPIMGNHDLACLRAMGWQKGPPDEAWYKNWAGHFWNPGGGTPAQYAADSGASLAEMMDTAHRAHREFLQGLPWFFEYGEYFFVHCGLESREVAPQRAELARREPLPNLWTHPQLRDKKLSTVSWEGWGRVVVSAHTRGSVLRRLVDPLPGDPHFVTPYRITLSAEVDHTGVLHAVLLPDRVFLHERTPRH